MLKGTPRHQHNMCFPCYRYTSEELSALPLNTATKLPEKVSILQHPLTFVVKGIKYGGNLVRCLVHHSHSTWYILGVVLVVFLQLPDAPLPPHHQDSSTASQGTSSSTLVLQPSSASLSTFVTTTPPGTGSLQTTETSASDAARLTSITTTKVFTHPPVTLLRVHIHVCVGDIGRVVKLTHSSNEYMCNLYSYEPFLDQVSQSGMVCSVCYRGRATVKQDKPEPLLQCSHCQGNSK